MSEVPWTAGQATSWTIATVPLSEAKDTLSALVDAAQSTHDIVTITRHGKPAAVLMSAEDLESLQETVFWLPQPACVTTLSRPMLRRPTGLRSRGPSCGWSPGCRVSEPFVVQVAPAARRQLHRLPTGVAFAIPEFVTVTLPANPLRLT